MTHSIADNDSIEIVDDDPYWDLRKAKPEQRNAIQGFEAVEIFGILADVDDAFLDDVMVIRRAGRAALHE